MSGLQFLPSLMVQCNITKQKPTDNAKAKRNEKTLRIIYQKYITLHNALNIVLRKNCAIFYNNNLLVLTEA